MYLNLYIKYGSKIKKTKSHLKNANSRACISLETIRPKTKFPDQNKTASVK